jgi:hypothetical protein
MVFFTQKNIFMKRLTIHAGNYIRLYHVIELYIYRQSNAKWEEQK